MTTSKRGRSREAVRADTKRRAAKREAPYHHGSLREAMLQAAESILERDGIGGLTLRAAAREAGVSNPRRVFISGQKRGVFGRIKRELRRVVGRLSCREQYRQD
jgi:hypothetical protein